MPSRALASRHPDLLQLDGHPSAANPPHVVEAAERAARRPAYRRIHGVRELRAAIAKRQVDSPGSVLAVRSTPTARRSSGSAGSRASTSRRSPSTRARSATCRRSSSRRWSRQWRDVPPRVRLGRVRGRGRRGLDARDREPAGEPDGRPLRPGDMDALARAHRERRAALSDEAYAGVPHDGREHLSPASDPDLAARTAVPRSVSKSLGTAAWRVGYAAGPAAAIETLAKAFARQSLAIDAVAQAAALAALTGPGSGSTPPWPRSARCAARSRRRPRRARSGPSCRPRPPSCGPWSTATRTRGPDGRPRASGSPPFRDAASAHAPRTLRIPFGGSPEAREALLAALASLASPARAS